MENRSENSFKVEAKKLPKEPVKVDSETLADNSKELFRMKILREIGDEVETERVRDLLRLISDEDTPEKELLEKQDSEIFLPNEVFDPVKEVRAIRTGSRKDSSARLEIFKKKLAYQKEGITEIQGILYREVDKNEEVKENDLAKSVAGLMAKYALSENQRGIFNEAMKIYVERHDGIVANTKDCLMADGKVDGEKLFGKIFKRSPQGKVEVVIKPITVYLKLYDIEDYAYVVSDAYVSGREANDEEIKDAERSDGTKLGNSHYPGMEHCVAVENTSKFLMRNSRARSEKTLIHEDQHNFNDLINESFVSSFERMKATSELHQENESGKVKIEKEENASDRDFYIGLKAADEICSYAKDGSSPSKIRHVLLENDTLYEYGEDYKKENKKEGEQFSDEYIELIESAIAALFDLIENGYSREQATAFLFTEYISDWKKIVERQLGNRKRKKPEERGEKADIVSIIDRIKKSILGRIKRFFDSFKNSGIDEQ